jgi:hypothetical protein
MADMQKVLDALAQLDHDNDDHWLPDGTPKTGVVQRIANDQTIKRRDIEAAGIVRENPLRADMIRKVIAQHAGEPITVENFAPYFAEYPDFNLGADDLAPYLDAAPIEFEGAPEPTPEPEAASEKLPEAIRDEPEAPPPAPTPNQIEAAVIRRGEAEQNLANLRVLQMTENDTERKLCASLAKAVTDFQASFPPITRDTLMKDYFASERARKASGQTAQPQSRPGNSYYDRARFYGGRGDANDFVRHSRPLTHEQAQKLVPGSTGPGTKGNSRGGSSVQQGPAKIHGER